MKHSVDIAYNVCSYLLEMDWCLTHQWRIWSLAFSCFYKLGFCMSSCSMCTLDVGANIVWERINNIKLLKCLCLNQIIMNSLPIIVPCSWTSTARSLKILFTSPIWCCISCMPWSLSSIIASLKAISLSKSKTSCLQHEHLK